MKLDQELQFFSTLLRKLCPVLPRINLPQMTARNAALASLITERTAFTRLSVDGSDCCSLPNYANEAISLLHRWGEVFYSLCKDLSVRPFLRRTLCHLWVFDADADSQSSPPYDRKFTPETSHSMVRRLRQTRNAEDIAVLIHGLRKCMAYSKKGGCSTGRRWSNGTKTTLSDCFHTNYCWQFWGNWSGKVTLLAFLTWVKTTTLLTMAYYRTALKDCSGSFLSGTLRQ